ncbi:hypothetical protein [Oceanithermus sp.]
MERYTAGYLSNGVGYLFAPRLHARITHVDIFLRAGPRYEHEADEQEDHVLLYVALSPWVEELEGHR